MKRQLYLTIMAVILYTLSCFTYDSSFTASDTQNTDNASKVVLIVADYLSFEDLRENEATGWLLENGYLALLNNRQNGKPSAFKSKATLGAGKRIEIASDMLGAGKDKKWHDLYRLNTGLTPPGDQPVYPQISKLRYLNKDEGYESLIGYIGDTVHAKMGKTCFLGNADSSMPNRSTILIPMDHSGSVDYGNTEETTVVDNRYPYFIRTDYDKLEELYKQFLPASSFIVIETGDMDRLEKNKTNMSTEQYEKMKQQIIDQIGRFIKYTLLAADTRENTPPTVILLSTYPSKENYDKGDKLTPILVYNGRGTGVLVSDGTKREGIVLNTELADYILYNLNMLQQSSISELNKDSSLSFITSLNRRTITVSLLRLPVLTTYAVYVIISLILCFFALLFPLFLRIGESIVVKLLICMNLLGPLVLLLLPAFLIRKPLPYIVLYFLITAALSLLLIKINADSHVDVFVICLLTAIFLTLDIVCGSPLTKQSVLGYDPIIGARFYGIGNELAGLFIGSSIFLLSSLKEINHKKIKSGYVIVYGAVCVCIVGLPFLGANLGGALSALTGYYIALLLEFDRKVRLRQVILLPVFLTILVLIIVALDLVNPGKGVSHVGLFFKDISQSGSEVLFSTFARKLAMNLRLIRYTIWTKVLLCIIFIMIVMYFKPVGVVKRVFRTNPHLKAGWLSITSASVFGLVLNDSGIVLAATAMIYVGFTLLLFCFDSITNQAVSGNGK